MENKHEFKIQDIARSSTVTRWHSVNCLRYPSIAEHSYLVTMYAREILKRINPNATAEEKLLLLEYCNFHDLPEVLTGDMATPIKRMLESYFPDGESPLDKIEEELCPEYKELKSKISGTYLGVVAKLADVMEAVKFIYVEGKSYIQKQEQNREIVESMQQLTRVISESFKEDKNHSELICKVNNLNQKFDDIISKENGDYIYAILLERKTNFKDRVEEAKRNYPEFNWEFANDVMKDLIHGSTTQLQFKDFLK